ncbi:Atrial natriuretic peptide-converting enzyme, partial [Operophtera brumata]
AIVALDVLAASKYSSIERRLQAASLLDPAGAGGGSYRSPHRAGSQDTCKFSIFFFPAGILFSGSPTTLEQYNTTVSSARAFGGLAPHPDHDHSGHDHSGHDHSGHNDSGLDHSGHNDSGLDHSGHNDSGLDHSGHNSSHDQSVNATQPTETQHGPETLSDEANVQTVGLDENDTSLYVPRTLEGQLEIDNEEFSQELEDTDSKEYREFVNSFTEALKRAVFDKSTLEKDDNDIKVEVRDPRSRVQRVASFTKTLRRAVFNVNLKNRDPDVFVEVIQLRNLKRCHLYSSGTNHVQTFSNKFKEIILQLFLCRNSSVIVTYRIHWTPKLNAEPSTELLTADSLTTKLDKYLAQNSRMISVYHIADGKIGAKPVLDICQIDKNQCEHGCEFDEMTLEFTCTCPHGQMLDMTNPKRCLMILENSYPLESAGNKDKEVKELSVNSNPSTTKPMPDKEKPITESVVNQYFDWKETNHAIPETTTAESDSDVNFSHIFGHGINEYKTEAPVPELISAPEPTVEPKAEPKPTSEPVAEPESSAEPAAEAAAEPAAELTPEPESAFKPESSFADKPTSEKPRDLEFILKQEAHPDPEPTAEPEPTTNPFELEPEPISKPEPTAEPTPASESEPKPEPEPEPNVETETKSEPEPMSEPAVYVESTNSDVLPTSEPDPESSSELTELKQNEHAANTDEKLTLFMNKEKYDSNSTEEMEKTPTKASISEPNIIDEPSPIPEIVSIFSKHSPKPELVAVETSETTTTETNDWLETQQNEKKTVVKPETPKNSESEPRSFKSIDIFDDELTTTTMPFRSIDIFDDEPTTTINVETGADEEIRVWPPGMAQENNKSEVFTNAPTEKSKTTTMKFSYMDEAPGNDVLINEHNIQVPTTEMPTENNDEKSQNPFTNESTTTTPEPKSEDLHYINQQAANHDEEKQLMDALNKKYVTKPEITTEIGKPNEGMDISFDTINNLYNQSSKSIDNQTKQETTDSLLNVYVEKESTTESNWLLEPVSEIKYEEAMNKLGKHETTESTLSKIEEFISSGKSKDDFEPDYLNNMSSNNKMSEQDEPLFGFAHDYDSEDSRMKRINTKKEVATEDAAKGSSETDSKSVTESPMPVDATTVIDYIYKSSEKSTEGPVTSNNVVVNSSTEAPFSQESKPAPVWEESEGDITVKQLLKPLDTHEETPTTTTRDVKIDEIVMPLEMSSTTTVAAEATQSQSTESPSWSSMSDSSTSSSIQTVSNSDTESQNTTPVNNLNVTIYEISSHHNSSGAAKDANVPAADFEDHETEMNPFLPEVENNKFLVKTLQEGHDIEPNNLTESQNENAEEHSNVSEANHDNATSTIAPVNTKEYTTFDELIKSFQVNKTEGAKEAVDAVKSEENTADHEETLPISTFLQDTDDLDISQERTTEHKTTIAENNLKNEDATPPFSAEDDSDYLSVVPIAEERSEEMEALKKSYSSESMQELNDISDSPKKSDRRTLNKTELVSVLNNEA